jgi:hypothetical protein
MGNNGENIESLRVRWWVERGIFFKDDYYYVINYYIVCMIYSGDPYLASSDVVKIIYFSTIIVYSQ